MKRIFSIATLVALFFVLAFSSCNKNEKLVMVNEGDNHEIFNDWVQKNAKLIDSEYVDEEGNLGLLYEIYNTHQTFFVPIEESNMKNIVNPVNYTMAVDFGDDYLDCSGTGHCCNIYTSGNGVTIRINPRCAAL